MNYISFFLTLSRVNNTTVGVPFSFSLDDSTCLRNSIFFLLASSSNFSCVKTIMVSVSSYPNSQVCNKIQIIVIGPEI